MYSNIMGLLSCIFTYSPIVLLFLHSGKLTRNIDWCLFFRRLKINHDVHEFILDSGTVGNTYFEGIVPDRRIGLANAVFVCKDKYSVCRWRARGEGGKGKCKGHQAVDFEQGI
jgi:hypothetical protein